MYDGTSGIFHTVSFLRLERFDVMLDPISSKSLAQL